MSNNENLEEHKNLTEFITSFEIRGKTVILKRGKRTLKVSLRDIITGSSVDLIKELGLSPQEASKLREEIKKEIVSKPLRDVVSFVRLSCLHTKPKDPLLVENELIDIEKEWSLYEAYREWDYPPIFVYDRERFVNLHRLEYALNMLEPEKVEEILLSLPKSVLKRVISVAQRWGFTITKGKEEDEGLFITNLSHNIYPIFYRPVPALRDPNYLRTFDWRDFVEYGVISYGLDIDPRLKIVREPTLLKGIEPRYNPHTLLVGNPGMGKSQFYKEAGEHYDRITDVSFIGTARSKNEVSPGVLHGSELPICLDQLESQNKPQVARFLMDFMEDGEAKWAVGGVKFKVKGRSILIFAANPLGSQPEKDFRYILDMLSYNPALGRRFGIIVYSNDFKPIKRRLSEREEKEWKENIRLFRAVEEYAWPELLKIMRNKKVEEWLNTPIPGYEERVKDLVLTVEDETLKAFLESHTLAQQRVRAAALYATLVYNLDKIALREYSIEDLLREADERLKAYVNLNLESIATITSSMEEMREYRARSYFHSLSEYLKHIISAIELYKREVRKEYLGRGQIPEELKRVRLDKLPYVPGSETYTYFSKCLDRLRRKRRGFDRVLIREVFRIDIIPKERYFECEILSWDPLPIEPLGTLSFLNFSNFSISQIPEKGDVLECEKSKKLNKNEENNQKGEESTMSRELEKLRKWRNGEKLSREVKELGESIPSPVHHITTQREIGESEPTAVSAHSTYKEDKYSCRDCIHFKDGKCEVYTHLSPEALKTSWLSKTCPEFKPRGEGSG